MLVCFLLDAEADASRLALARAMELKRENRLAASIRAARVALTDADAVDAAELHKVAGGALRRLADRCAARAPGFALAAAADYHLERAAALNPFDVVALHERASFLLSRAATVDDAVAAAEACRKALGAARDDFERSYPAHDLAVAEGLVEAWRRVPA